MVSTGTKQDRNCLAAGERRRLWRGTCNKAGEKPHAKKAQRFGDALDLFKQFVENNSSLVNPIFAVFDQLVRISSPSDAIGKTRFLLAATLAGKTGRQLYLSPARKEKEVL